MKTENTLALPVGITLDRFIKSQQDAFPYATGELSQLLRDIALASKIINREINRAGLIDVWGLRMFKVKPNKNWILSPTFVSLGHWSTVGKW
jgi:hypothetical protein